MAHGEKNNTGAEIAHGSIIRESKRNVLSEGHLADCIILQWINRYAKPTIAWRDQNGNDVAWIAGHEFLDVGLTTLHKHISIETSDLSGQLQTRFGIGYGADQADIQIRSIANIDSLDATLKLKSTGSQRANISRFSTGAFGQLVFQTNEVDKWGIQQRNDATEDLFIRDVANGINGLKIKHGTGLILIQRTRNAVPSDADLDNESSVFYLDQATNELKVKSKYSTGVVKTGVVATLV